MGKRNIIVLLLIATLIMLLVACPVYIDLSSNNDSIKSKEFKANQTTIQELIGEDLTDSISIYVILSYEDLISTQQIIPNHKILYSSDKDLINKFLKIRFTCKGGDMTTLGSKLIICQDRQKVYESQISLNNGIEGLQNDITGWIEPTDRVLFTNLLSKLDIYWFPLLIVNTKK